MTLRHQTSGWAATWCGLFLLLSAVQAQTPPSPGAEADKQLGEMYEHQGRWVDAEKAYTKAFETAPEPLRPVLKRAIENAVAHQEDFWHKYVWAPLDVALKAIIGVLVVTGLVVIVGVLLWNPAKWCGTQWGKNRWQLAGLEDAAGLGDGAQLSIVLKDMVETAQEYYKPRDLFRFGSFSSLMVVDSPQAPDLVQLAADLASNDAGKVLNFIVRTFCKPRYRISGAILRQGSYSVASLRLNAGSETIGVWNVPYDPRRALYYQKMIAYEVAIRLKDHVRTTGDQ